MKVLITGGSGFLGGHVVAELRSRGHDVVGLARRPSAAARLVALGAEVVPGDLDDPASVDAAFSSAGADALVNVASLGFGHAPAVVAAAEDAGLRRAVFVSTAAIYTTLDAPSKATRVAAEATVRDGAFDWTIVRPTMIYGTPADRNIARLLRFLRRSPVVLLPGGGRSLQQPVHVDDAAHGLVEALERDVAIGHEYDFGGPQPLTFRQLVQEAARAVGRAPRLVPIPLRPVYILARGYERVSRTPRLRAEQVARLVEDKAVDIVPASRDLAYQPRSFASGVRDEAAMLAGTGQLKSAIS